MSSSANKGLSSFKDYKLEESKGYNGYGSGLDSPEVQDLIKLRSNIKNRDEQDQLLCKTCDLLSFLDMKQCQYINPNDLQSLMSPSQSKSDPKYSKGVVNFMSMASSKNGCEEQFNE